MGLSFYIMLLFLLLIGGFVFGLLKKSKRIAISCGILAIIMVVIFIVIFFLIPETW